MNGAVVAGVEIGFGRHVLAVDTRPAKFAASSYLDAPVHDGACPQDAIAADLDARADLHTILYPA